MWNIALNLSFLLERIIGLDCNFVLIFSDLSIIAARNKNCYTWQLNCRESGSIAMEKSNLAGYTSSQVTILVLNTKLAKCI